MTPSKTTFAGFERLAPGDPLSSDGYAFQYQNPLIADQLSKIGAVTHKHDAHAAMANPSTAPTVALAATGGSIPSGTSIHVVYTLLDGQAGESLPTSAVVATTGAGYGTPGAPTVAASYAAGTLLSGTLLYGITVTDGAGGETALGAVTTLTVDPGHANAEALVSGLTAVTNTASGSASTAGWRLWRSVDGGSTWDLMGTGSHSTDTFTDTGAAGNCSVSPPFDGTTVGTNKLTVTISPTAQPAAATFFSIYADTTGAFLSPCLLGTYPVADFGSAKVYTSLAVLAGQPPAVSRCYPGASQINPATDILGYGTVASTQQSGTTYTFALTDASSVVESTGASAATFTIPTHASVAFPVGTVIEVYQSGAGQVLIAGAGGVTLRAYSSLLHTAGQYATIGLRQRTADEWVISGRTA